MVLADQKTLLGKTFSFEMFDVSSCLIISIRKTTIFHNLAPRFDSNHPLSDFENEPSDRKGPWLFKVLFLFRNFTYFMEREKIESEQSTHRWASARFPLGTRARTRTDCVFLDITFIIIYIFIIYFLYIFHSYFVRRCRIFEFLGVCRGSALPFYTYF